MITSAALVSGRSSTDVGSTNTIRRPSWQTTSASVRSVARDVHGHLVDRCRRPRCGRRRRPSRTQPAGRHHDLGLLGELAVGRGLELLAGVEVPADQAPLLRVDGRVLVALLEQDPAAAVDQDDAGEAVALGHGCHLRSDGSRHRRAVNRRPRIASSTSPTARRRPTRRACSSCQVCTAASMTSRSATSRRSARASLRPARGGGLTGLDVHQREPRQHHEVAPEPGIAAPVGRAQVEQPLGGAQLPAGRARRPDLARPAGRREPLGAGRAWQPRALLLWLRSEPPCHPPSVDRTGVRVSCRRAAACEARARCVGSARSSERRDRGNEGARARRDPVTGVRRLLGLDTGLAGARPARPASVGPWRSRAWAGGPTWRCWRSPAACSRTAGPRRGARRPTTRRSGGATSCMLAAPPTDAADARQWLGVFEAAFPAAGHRTFGIDGTSGTAADAAPFASLGPGHRGLQRDDRDLGPRAAAAEPPGDVPAAGRPTTTGSSRSS